MSPEVYRLSVVQLLPPHGCAMSLRDKIPSVQAPTGAPLSVMRLLALTVVLYTFFVLYMKGALAFELFQGDVVSYWNDSLTLATPYSTWWVPGYPAMIASVRAATFGVLPPLAVMMLIAGSSYVIGVAVFALLASEAGITSPREVSLLFAVHPFVGLTSAVYPDADSVATALLLLCLLYYHREQWVSCAVFFGLMILTHKAIWFFALPLGVIAFIKHRESRLPLVVASVPLLALIAAGAAHHNDILWAVRSSMKNLLTSQTSFFPVFDGIVASLIAGGFAKVSKVVLVLSALSLAGMLLLPCYRRRFWIGVSVAVGLLIMAVVVNRDNVWAIFRFSKVLLLPLGYVLLTPDSAFVRRWGGLTPIRFLLLSVGAIASNVAFGYYMAKIYFVR